MRTSTEALAGRDVRGRAPGEGPLIFAATGPQLASIWAATPAHEPEAMNKPGSIIAAVAGIAVLSGFGLTHHHTATATHTATAAVSTMHPVSHTPATAAHLAAAAAAHAAAHPAAADPSLVWLASAGGQAQVTFNNQVATLAADLEIENGSPTVANHLLFEADARAVRAQATRSSPPPRCSRPSTGPPTSTC